MQVAIWTLHDPMFFYLSRSSTLSATVEARLTLLARLFSFFGWRLFLVRFHESWWLRFLLFQFLDAFVGRSQLPLESLYLLQGLGELLFQTLYAFVCCHILSVSERSSLNSIRSSGLRAAFFPPRS